jgi:hypothetical protein
MAVKRELQLKWLDPKTLKPNPQNWRSHPVGQKQLLDAVLGEVGWAGVALMNLETGHLIDGHARRDWAIEHGKDMPVLVGRWSENDEKKILATLDPLAGMAERMDDVYQDLVQGIETDDSVMDQWFDGLFGESGFNESFKPDKVPEPDIVGDDTRTGRFILIYENESQKELWCKSLGIAGNKVVYSIKDLNHGD